jgi:hypothetical protein
MNDYVFLIGLIVVLGVYLLYFKEKLIKWEDRDSIEKSFSIRFTVIIVTGIVLLAYKILKDNNIV